MGGGGVGGGSPGIGCFLSLVGIRHFVNLLGSRRVLRVGLFSSPMLRRPSLCEDWSLFTFSSIDLYSSFLSFLLLYSIWKKPVIFIIFSTSPGSNTSLSSKFGFCLPYF